MSGIGSMDCDRSLTNGLKDELEAVPCAEQEETRRVGPTVARFAVASMDAPRLTETISLAEKVHAALVRRSNGSPVFTGCDESSIPLKGHSHAYIFCESNVGLGRGERGEITHITVYALSGFGQKEKRAIEGLTRVWGHGLDDLQLVLLGVGQPEDFAGFNTTKGDCLLFAKSKCWVSRTPFVPTRHPKATRAGVPKRDASGLQIGSLEHDLRRLLVLDGFPAPISVEPVAGTILGDKEVPWHDFLRRRETGKGRPAANGAGYGFWIEFPEPVQGPVAVGYGAHFGMGGFVPVGIAFSREVDDLNIGVNFDKNGDLHIAQITAKIRFISQAQISIWAGQSYGIGLSSKLRDRICAVYIPSKERQKIPGPYKCSGCEISLNCQYGKLFLISNVAKQNSAQNIANFPRPIILVPPTPGSFSPLERTSVGFSLIGRAIESFPFLFLALKDLGQSGLGKGHESGGGRFDIESAEFISNQSRELAFRNGILQNKIGHITFSDILEKSKEHDGQFKLRFLTPTLLEDKRRYSSRPSFGSVVSHLLSRANLLSSVYGTGVLYDREAVSNILRTAKKVKQISAHVTEIHRTRRINNMNKPIWKPPFFTGDLIYEGYIPKDIMALLSLGEIINIGNMADFGYGMFRLEKNQCDTSSLRITYDLIL